MGLRLTQDEIETLRKQGVVSSRTGFLGWATTEQVAIEGEQVLVDGERLVITVEKDAG